MIVKKSTRQKGFTLLELLVVIAIIALLAAVTVPALNNMKRADATVSAVRQLLDDVGRARQLAISRHTKVYMVFCPQGFWNLAGYVPLPEGTNLYDKQLTGYAFVTLRSVGDQPDPLTTTPDYIGPWHTLPEGTFIPSNKFFGPNITVTDPPGSPTPDHKYPVNKFAYATFVPFPSEEAWRVKKANFASVPYIAFNYLGQLDSGQGDEYIPLARGTVAHSRDPQTKQYRQALPELIEKPPGNSTNAFNLIHIDRLTGRARLIRQEISGF